MKNNEPPLSPLRLRRYEMVPTPSQREIGRRTGIDAATIGDLETGRCEMLLRHAQALGPIYGVSAPELLRDMAEWLLSLRGAPRKRGRAA